MKVTIHPSSLYGTIAAPASKSSMQRACAAALLSRRKVMITHPGHSNDDKAALDIIKRLGALVTDVDSNTISIESDFLDSSNRAQSKESEIHCGESGLSIRMFAPIVALCSSQITINGEGSLLGRPLNFFDEVLPQLGVHVQSNDGKLPIVIQGPLQPRNIEIDGSMSSQFLTGLLLAYAAHASQGIAKDPITIKVKSLKSKPYIDLTLDVMQRFDLPVPENKDYKEFVFTKKENIVQSNPEKDKPLTYAVEGDWSGAAFLLVAGAIAGPITVTGLNLASTQADKAIIDALMEANAGLAIEAKGIKVHPATLRAFKFDATDCPDLFPPLVSLAAYCNGITTIKGVSRLAYKESNRGVTLQEEFSKMGLKIDLLGDEMQIHGGKGLKGAQVHSRHDHRIAMACAVAALKAEGNTTIEEAMAVNKSYPDFYSHLASLGAHLKSGWSEVNFKKIIFKFR